jgi:hypothetical protein
MSHHDRRCPPPTSLALALARSLSEAGKAATLVDSTTARTSKTGFPRFDEAPLATIEGGMPEWHMLSMAYDMR